MSEANKEFSKAKLVGDLEVTLQNGHDLSRTLFSCRQFSCLEFLFTPGRRLACHIQRSGVNRKILDTEMKRKTLTSSLAIVHQAIELLDSANDWAVHRNQCEEDRPEATVDGRQESGFVLSDRSFGKGGFVGIETFRLVAAAVKTNRKPLCFEGL